MIDLKWEVPTRGFELRDNGKPFDPQTQLPVKVEGPWLVTVERRTTPIVTSYQVADRPALFKQFAALPISHNSEQILAFAGVNGRLFARGDLPFFPGPLSEECEAGPAEPVGTNETVQRADSGSRPLYEKLHAERLDLWHREIRDLNHAVSWWDRTRKLDLRWLEQFVIRPKIGSPTLLLELPGSGISKEIPAESLQRSLRTLAELAWDALVSVVETRLRNHRLRIGLQRDQRQRRSREPTEPVFDLTLQPDDLISALWVQFVQAIYGRKDIEACQYCAVFFEPSAQRRGGARFCTDACRLKAFRARKAQVLDLVKNGVPAKEIAHRFGTSVGQIRRWSRKLSRELSR